MLAFIRVHQCYPWFILFGTLAVRAGDEPEPFEVPYVGRPAEAPFSEAAGKFKASGHAEPTIVQAEQPLLFTFRVEATGTVVLPPKRIDLAKIVAFDERFYIEDPNHDTYDANKHVWEFVYRLKPRRTNVSEIPSVPFVYFDSAINPPSKGFQTQFTEEIPLQVTAGETLPKPLRPVPDVFLQTQTGPALLSHREPWSLPSWPVLVTLLLVPLFACGGWYAVWRRLYPDAARLLKQRRSWAATLALKQLRHLPRSGLEERAAHVAAVVTTYLHQRLDLATAEPTPAEAADHVRSAGYTDALTKRTEQFFQECDAARFFPKASAADLPAFAQQLILDLEAHSWASRPS